MVDMYPERVRDILGAPEAARFRLADAWFFDARPHLDPRQLRETPPVPRTVYPGSVSRLFATWGVLPQGTLDAADPPPALRLPLPGRQHRSTRPRSSSGARATGS